MRIDRLGAVSAVMMIAFSIVCFNIAFSCSSPGGDTDAGFDGGLDAGTPDSGTTDSGTDAGEPDSGADAGADSGADGGLDSGTDGGVKDAGIADSGFDSGAPDAGFDSGAPDGGVDGGAADAGTADAGKDGGSADVGGYPCSPNCPAEDMVTIPSGLFHMGCHEDVDSDCYSEENPYHDVTLSAYSMDKFETTVSAYSQCVAKGACTSAATGTGCDGSSDKPRNCVDWSQAKAYCQWVGKRLPTEAEWEKAARGTDGFKYPWGNMPEVSCSSAVMSDDGFGGDGCGTGGTMAVGSKSTGASPYGAQDMIGNVWEWVNDWYDSGYYSVSPSNDPQGPVSGSYRVLRGGAWNNDSVSYLRSSARNSDIPTKAFNDYGFRCAR